LVAKNKGHLTKKGHIGNDPVFESQKYGYKKSIHDKPISHFGGFGGGGDRYGPGFKGYTYQVDHIDGPKPAYHKAHFTGYHDDGHDLHGGHSHHGGHHGKSHHGGSIHHGGLKWKRNSKPEINYSHSSRQANKEHSSLSYSHTTKNNIPKKDHSFLKYSHTNSKTPSYELNYNEGSRHTGLYGKKENIQPQSRDFGKVKEKSIHRKRPAYEGKLKKDLHKSYYEAFPPVHSRAPSGHKQLDSKPKYSTKQNRNPYGPPVYVPKSYKH